MLLDLIQIIIYIKSHRLCHVHIQAYEQIALPLQNQDFIAFYYSFIPFSSLSSPYPDLVEDACIDEAVAYGIALDTFLGACGVFLRHVLYIVYCTVAHYTNEGSFVIECNSSLVGIEEPESWLTYIISLSLYISILHRL